MNYHRHTLPRRLEQYLHKYLHTPRGWNSIQDYNHNNDPLNINSRPLNICVYNSNTLHLGVIASHYHILHTKWLFHHHRLRSIYCPLSSARIQPYIIGIYPVSCIASSPKDIKIDIEHIRRKYWNCHHHNVHLLLLVYLHILADNRNLHCPTSNQ